MFLKVDIPKVPLAEQLKHIVRMFKSSNPEVLFQKSVLKNFAKFIGKHLYQSFFFNKVAGLRPATLLKKRSWHKCFPVDFATFLRISFFIEHPGVTSSKCGEN